MKKVFKLAVVLLSSTVLLEVVTIISTRTTN